MIGLIPLINFCVIGGLGMVVCFEKLGFRHIIIDCRRSSCLSKMLLFLFFLPWNTFVIALSIVLSAIPAALALPLIVLPSYYLNIRSYYEIMSYWWSGNRFAPLKDEEEKEEPTKEGLLGDQGLPAKRNFLDADIDLLKNAILVKPRLSLKAFQQIDEEEKGLLEIFLEKE